MKVIVQSEPFDAGEQLNKFTRETDSPGAVVSFSGVVRDIPEGLAYLNIEHYPGMAEKAIRKVCNQACQRWNLDNILVIHRFGELKKGEAIMMVLTASQVRLDSFNAAEFLMDFLKSSAPFWKKEIGLNKSSWVATRDKDEQAIERWRNS